MNRAISRLAVCGWLLAFGAGPGCAARTLTASDTMTALFRSPDLAAPEMAGAVDLTAASDDENPLALPARMDLTKEELRPQVAAGDPPDAAVELAEAELRRRGLHFGTDGTAASLLAYVKYSHGLIAPGSARPGDLVFFDLVGRGCADHVGVIEAVDASGRMTFREWRAGAVRTSYVSPEVPGVRRASDGRVLNSFLRIKREEDPPASRYFAGEMLCAVGRAAGHRGR